MSDLDRCLSRERIAEAIEKAPALAVVLKKLADKVARGVRLGASFSSRDLDYGAQRELERLFGTIGRRLPNGAFRIQLHESLREPVQWREALAYFGLEKQPCNESAVEVFARLKLLLPETDWFVDALSQSDEIARFLARAENRDDWLRLAKYVIEKFFLARHSITTLSQLGADIFRDSKKLRSGALRNQLRAIIAAILRGAKLPERELFEGVGIYDNPYTCSVTFSAPVSFVADGKEFDFPRVLHESGLACQLPLATLLEITGLSWHGRRPEIVTSENASPFLDLVKDGVPAVYTEGYPNAAVKLLLRQLDGLKIKCTHEGDADLDGFLIARQIRDCIPATEITAQEILSLARRRHLDVGIALTGEQRKRLADYLAKDDPDPFVAAEAKELLAWGRWIEQESFASVLSKEGGIQS
ncbi:MAG: hypothetical protein ACI4QT_01605 [Kiritimatiellia bacterium]